MSGMVDCRDRPRGGYGLSYAEIRPQLRGAGHEDAGWLYCRGPQAWVQAMEAPLSFDP